MNKALNFLITLLLLVGLVPTEVRADDTVDASDALAQARQIFRYADDGDFNSMYDLMHPDAQAVISRETAVATFKAIYRADSVGRGVPTGIEFGPWTWGVTGQEYDRAAAVTFEQPYEQNGEEQTLNDTMYLVQDQ